jgi:ParB/RepB/Spo0J family partition protein
MAVNLGAARLKEIDPNLIDPNDENPRLVFRQEEMEQLLASIDKYGIQVPVTVFPVGERFRLIDGERRWRCAKKLRLKTIPALVHRRPSELQNLLLMYNIHALREQWDYFTIASKLDRVIRLLTKDLRREPNESELSDATGLTRGQIRRCRLILDLPERYKEELLRELALPKSQQKLSEDFFLEMEKSLKTVFKRFPEYQEGQDKVRTALVAKFRGGVISAVTDFRQLSKIATATKRLGLSQSNARKALDRIFDSTNKFGIRAAYQATAEFDYSERQALRSVESLRGFLDSVLEQHKEARLDQQFLNELRELYKRLRKILRD